MIYRCENMEGHGPYAQLPNGNWTWFNHHNDAYGYGKHPLPYFDGLGDYRYGNLQFGFSSLEQLYSWFSEKERIEIVAKGFRFVCIEPNGAVHHGGHQCMFDRATAKVIGPLENVLP